MNAIPSLDVPSNHEENHVAKNTLYFVFSVPSSFQSEIAASREGGFATCAVLVECLKFYVVLLSFVRGLYVSCLAVLPSV